MTISISVRGSSAIAGTAKAAIRGAPSSTLDEQLDFERNAQRKCGLTDDYKEGVNAFKARRVPRFVGR